MVIDFTPSTKESEEARILKLKEDAVEAGIKAKEILNSIGIKYIIRLYKEGGCIKFYKGSKCIMMAGLLAGTNELISLFIIMLLNLKTGKDLKLQKKMISLQIYY